MFGMTSSENMNALDLLRHDHDEVDAMFKQYEDIKEGRIQPKKVEPIVQEPMLAPALEPPVV